MGGRFIEMILKVVGIFFERRTRVTEGKRRIVASERFAKGAGRCYHRYVSTKYRDIVVAVRCKNILSCSRRHGAAHRSGVV